MENSTGQWTDPNESGAENEKISPIITEKRLTEKKEKKQVIAVSLMYNAMHKW